MLRKLMVLTIVLTTLTGFVYAKGKKITIAGSTTVFPIAQRCAEVYMDKYDDVNISIRGGGSGVGIASIVAGKVDIANASRPIKSKELKTAREKGINPIGNIIAKDGIAAVVYSDNSVSGLTISQMKDIYSGKIANWKELGGSNMAIVVISRDVSSGTFEVFKKKVLKGARVKSSALMLASNKAVASTVAQTPGAIGYVGLGYLTGKIKALKIEGIMPSVKTVNNGRYKIARPLFMYTDGKPKGEVKKFIKFIQSSEGQNIAEELGYVPLR